MGYGDEEVEIFLLLAIRFRKKSEKRRNFQR